MDKHVDNEQAIAVMLAAAVGVGLVVHAAAELSSFLCGSSLHASIAESLSATIRLPANLEHPANAWKPSADFTAVIFWVTLTAIAGVSCMVTIFVVRIFGEKQSRLGVTQHAGLARTHDLKTLKVRAPMPGRITLGRKNRRLLATESQTSLAVVGPTGCGKTAGFAIPAILEWAGPVIATSVKTDLLAATLRLRRSRGSVWIFDPTNCSGEQSSEWNPLAHCRTWQGAQQMASWMCESAQPRLDSVSDGDYWYTQAKKALAPYLFAAAISGLAMSDVVTWIDTQDQNRVQNILRNHASSGTTVPSSSADIQKRQTEFALEINDDVENMMRQWFAEAGPHFRDYSELPVDKWPAVFQAQREDRIAHAALQLAKEQHEVELSHSDALRDRMAPLTSVRALWDKDQRLRDSVFATVENIVAPYSSLTNGADDDSSIDFKRWLDGDNTIYVVASSHDQARLRPLLTTFVQQAIRHAFDTAVRNGGSLNTPCLALLDEAGNIAPLRDLPAYASTARSHGISLVSIWQDIAQIKAIYRDRAQTVINNHRAKLFGTGIADEQTLEYLSRLIGDVANKEHNVSRESSGGRKSVSEHTSYRRAAPVDVIRRIRRNEAILLYGSELPARITLRPWFNEPTLRQLVKQSSK